ncbi:MAG: hypothetical protein JST75_05860 [Bacteroidetes bacterium]|nr:hypothetical protein [Bacteroidota bacterium]
MKKITSVKDLHEAIQELELKKSDQLVVIQNQFADFYETLKPANIIKNTFQSVFSSSDSRSNIVGSVIGLGTGLLSKKLLVGKSVNVFRKMLGAAVEFGIAGLIAKNATRIKEKGSDLIGKIFKKNHKSQHEITDLESEY